MNNIEETKTEKKRFEAIMPPNWTIEEIREVAEENMFGMTNDGICVNCGDVRDGCEPDAERYPCYSCEENAVFGAELLFMANFGI